LAFSLSLSQSQQQADYPGEHAIAVPFCMWGFDFFPLWGLFFLSWCHGHGKVTFMMVTVGGFVSAWKFSN
jgi:hypothetical protein